MEHLITGSVSALLSMTVLDAKTYLQVNEIGLVILCL